jgi:RNA polymerase sigma-70 factor (ECF subfamily)
VHALIDACRRGNASEVADLLSDRSALIVDSGHSPQPAAPLAGSVATALELLALLDTFPARVLAEHDVNGAAGIVVRSNDRVVAVISVGVRAAKVSQLWAVTNPDKLRHWNRK